MDDGKSSNDTNSICIFCLQLCSGRGCSGRYEALQGNYKDHDEVIVLYSCDQCMQWDNSRIYNMQSDYNRIVDENILKMPDGREFIINAIHRMND